MKSGMLILLILLSCSENSSNDQNENNDIIAFNSCSSNGIIEFNFDFRLNDKSETIETIYMTETSVTHSLLESTFTIQIDSSDSAIVTVKLQSLGLTIGEYRVVARGPYSEDNFYTFTVRVDELCSTGTIDPIYNEQMILGFNDNSSFGSLISAQSNKLLIASDTEDISGKKNSGAVYSYSKNLWQLEQTLNISSPSDYDRFGFHLNSNSNYALITAPGTANFGGIYKDSGSWIQNFTFSAYNLEFSYDMSENYMIHSSESVDKSSVFIRRLSNDTWSLDTLIITTYSKYGIHVAIDETDVLVAFDDFFYGIDDLTFYYKTDSGWQINSTFDINTPDNQFDTDYGVRLIELHNDIALVADPNVNLRQGRVLVYRKVNNSWQFSATLTAHDGVEGARFGHMVAINDTYIAIAAPNGLDINGHKNGAVYLYNHQLTLVAKVYSSRPNNYDGYSESIELDDSYLYVGSFRFAPFGIDSTRTGAVFIYNGF